MLLIMVRKTVPLVHPCLCIHYTPDITLTEVVVKSVSNEAGICVSCYFTSDSTAEGCTIQLYNDEHTFSFNISRQEYDELLILECFQVPEAGVFSVLVYYDMMWNGIDHNISCGLPDVIINTGM